MRAVFAGLVFSSATLALAQAPKITYEPVWSEMVAANAVVPLKVSIKNSGPNTAGMLVLHSEGGDVAYPVELPKGANKEIVAYLPRWSSYQSASFELKSATSSVVQPVELKGDSNERLNRVGVISSAQGLLTSLRVKTKGANSLWWDATCKPESAPDRSVGYSGLDAIVLGDGSERLSDGAVSALQRYVLAGGRLVFIGGASAPWLRDVRWKGILPIEPASTRTLSSVPPLAARTGVPLKGEVSVTTAVPTPGTVVDLSHDQTPLIVTKQVGLGRTVFFAFDPFSAPLQTWLGRDGLFKLYLAKDPSAEAYIKSQSQDLAANTTDADSDDPFRTKMPSAGTICAILFSFLFVVIPVNFFVLQKFNRREWAWFSIPVVSFAFSGLIFMTASGLYDSGAARMTLGVLVTHDGLEQGVFVGNQHIFIPKGGNYNLGWNGVESAQNEVPELSMWGGAPQMQGPPELIDIGQIVIPRLEASNLTFRNLKLIQSVPFEGQIRFAPVIRETESTVKVDGTVVNATAYKITGLSIAYKGCSEKIPDLDPGQKRSVSLQIVKLNPNQRSNTLPPIGNSLAMIGRIEGVSIGTMLGEEPKKKRGCHFVHTWSHQ